MLIPPGDTVIQTARLCRMEGIPNKCQLLQCNSLLLPGLFEQLLSFGLRFIRDEGLLVGHEFFHPRVAVGPHIGEVHYDPGPVRSFQQLQPLAHNTALIFPIVGPSRRITQGVVQKDLPRIASDKGLLQQAFLNLLNNAIDAVEDGGRIDVRLRTREPDSVVIEIEDDGCGIPERDQGRLFEPFFSTKHDQGTGLGLSITHGIITKLGGKVAVSSRVGVGTKFTITRPRDFRGEPKRGEKP